jgi:hypothetical protein
MSEILRKEVAKAPAIETYDFFRALPLVGPRIHWGDSSCI